MWSLRLAQCKMINSLATYSPRFPTDSAVYTPKQSTLISMSSLRTCSLIANITLNYVTSASHKKFIKTSPPSTELSLTSLQRSRLEHLEQHTRVSKPISFLLEFFCSSLSLALHPLTALPLWTGIMPSSCESQRCSSRFIPQWRSI